MSLTGTNNDSEKKKAPVRVSELLDLFEEEHAPERSKEEEISRPKAKASRKPPSNIRSRAGRRNMKEYPITFNELVGLGTLGLLATISFSAGNFFLTTWWQLQQNFAFSPPHDLKTIGYWQGVMNMSFLAACFFGVVGIGLLLGGGAMVLTIWRETEHADD